jgi:dTDP-4-amino-4,6-dideoxygalactose transaminase
MIPLMKVHLPPNVGEIVNKVVETGFVTEGEFSDEFERLFGEYINNPNVRLVNSCTSALALAAHMCDLQPGDEVITTAMTCMATNEPFHNIGAKLIFADIESDTGNIDVNDIERKITKKTKAIVMVHWAGQPCNIDAINTLAAKHGIKTIEDAAHAVRSTYKDKRIGSHSDYVCFSFQAVKHLTTIDGGAIACKTFEDAEAGFKYHMNNVNAAIGIEQMKYIDTLIDAHIENGKYYDENIKNSNVRIPRRIEDGSSSYWIYSVFVDDKVKFKNYLAQHGIAADVAHVRNDEYSCFKEYKLRQPGLDAFSKQMINIPVGWWLTRGQREYIVNTINAYEN